MMRLFILLVLATNLNYVLTESSPELEDEISEAEATAFAEASSSDSSSATAIASSSAEANSDCNEQKCGKNQVYDPCPSSCPPRTCATKDIAFSCVAHLKPGDPKCPPPKCRCANNYYSNDKGECVSKNECPITKPCGINEIYVSCPSCEIQSCEYIGVAFSCAPRPEDLPCNGECRCKTGYYKNSIGQCISEAECKKCGKNQIFDLCPSSCPPRTCATKDIAFKCKAPLNPGDPKCPRPKCRCDDGYYSNDKGECVSKEQCPITKKCGFNEIYVSCPEPSCGGQTCENIGKRFPCPFIPANHTCNGDCRCKPGYYRNKAGQCISEAECKKCGKNQIYDLCPSSCPPRTCDTKDIAFKCKAPLKPGDPKCPRPKCRCDDGYYSNDKGECVAKEQCPTKNCGINEVYNSCPAPTCANKTCENIGKIYHCPKLPSDYPCKGECQCKSGYYRNKIGQCITEEECKQCPGEYEYFSCGGACDNVCDKLRTQSQANCPIVNVKCNPMCYCLEGYARDANNKCIPISQCPPSETCGVNELYYPCPVPTCVNQTCENIGKKFNCPLIPSNYPCKGECRCKPGYYKNKIGDCITEDECKQCSGPYEFFSCGGACDNECDKLSRQGQNNCPIINIKCNPMCYCEDGYARDADKQCIPISQCPPECKENEEYSKCPNSVCRAKSCDELGYPLPCITLDANSTDCGEPGCICQSGYVRNKNGLCIPDSDCPSCGGDPNAVSGCGNYCTRCSNYKEEPRFCPLFCRVNSCDCRPNYIYDDFSKKCIPTDKCPPQCGANEVVSDCANSPCIRNCATKDLNLQCKPYPPGCKAGCVCADGYFRDGDGVCVPTDKCPPNKPECGENEEYSDCPNQVCQAKECKELGFPLACNQVPRNSTDCGKPSCICKPGFLRNKDGVCIDTRECPSCGGDPNAWSGCGTFCTRCDNYKNKARACPASCMLNGCECRPNHVYNPRIKKCVLPKQCPVCSK